jgi:heme exporter protein C
LEKLMRWLFALLLGLVTLATFWVPDAEGFREPSLARVIFFHLPCAIGSSLFLAAGAYFSVAYLVTKRLETDIRAGSAMSMGALLAVLTMITGILFSKVQWGAWWQWDPRQTSFLIVLLIYSAYFALRAAFTLFLIFVYPRLPHVVQKSFHPSSTIAQGGFDPYYRTVLYSLFALLMITCIWLYRMSVRAGMLELRLLHYGTPETDRRGAAPTGVVRPISLHDESRPEAEGS